MTGMKIFGHVLFLSYLVGAQILYWSTSGVNALGHVVFWIAWAIIAAIETTLIIWDVK